VSLLSVEAVSARLRGRHRNVLAVDGVTLSLEKKQTLAIVGQSGAGKSTLAKIVAGLLRPSAGRVLLDGVDVSSLDARDRSARVQLVFQDAAGALDPRMSVGASVGEPLAIRGIEPGAVRARVDQVLALVGLPSSFEDRRPSALSGGERRRVGLARALVLDPALLVLDEPFAGLDPPVAAQIGSLLLDAQEARGTSHLLITHDLRMASDLASSIGVMFEGRLVELGPVADVLARPKHPYADRLVRALPQ
jgi:ABC-type glutathione transport system ATPase component